ncbi:MAG: hypothetical protein HQ494_13280 [Rhodospirillales bacterium]|nr:hypothetical protein [Rhodospirillales bacterium]
METLSFETTVALIMVSVVVVLFVWFRQSEAAGSLRRRVAMMAHIGLDPGIAIGESLRIKAIMRVTRRRCAACPNEGYCERWLAGEVEGPNTFCPNAPTFEALAGSPG